MKKYLLAAALAGASCLSLPAHALTTICWSPDQSCTIEGEQKIYLDKSTSVVGSGHVGSQTGSPLVQFVSSTLSDYKSGFATVKPADDDSVSSAGVDAIYSFDISVPGHTFGDVLWDVQMFNTKVKDVLYNFTAYAYLGGTLQAFHTFFGLKPNSDLSFGAVGIDGGQFDELYLTTTTGFSELKHFQISGLDGVVINPTSGVPEASTWAMLLTGFGFVAYAAYYRRRSTVGASATT